MCYIETNQTKSEPYICKKNIATIVKYQHEWTTIILFALVIIMLTVNVIIHICVA